MRKWIVLGAMLTLASIGTEARAECSGNRGTARPRVFSRVVRAVVRAPALVFAERRARVQYRRGSSCQ